MSTARQIQSKSTEFVCPSSTRPQSTGSEQRLTARQIRSKRTEFVCPSSTVHCPQSAGSELRSTACRAGQGQIHHNWREHQRRGEKNFEELEKWRETKIRPQNSYKYDPNVQNKFYELCSMSVLNRSLVVEVSLCCVEMENEWLSLVWMATEIQRKIFCRRIAAAANTPHTYASLLLLSLPLAHGSLRAIRYRIK